MVKVASRVEKDERIEKLQCGIDEAGRGPVIGPMVMSIVCADPQILRKIGARDSKTLSRSRREQLFEDIRKNARTVEHVILTASELNRLMDDNTLNEIELKHAISLAGLVSEDVVVDCFDVNEQRASKIMTEKTGKKIICAHKADRDFPAVSAASIMSKVIRDREIEKIKEKFGNVGSGYPADPETRAFIEESFRKGPNIEGIIRTHWSTVKELKKKARTGRLI